MEQQQYDINTVANWFLNKYSMSHKKLQKLCYYAEAWHQALYNSPLLRACLKIQPDLTIGRITHLI